MYKKGKYMLNQSQPALKNKIKKSRTNTESKFLNSVINIKKLGEKIYDRKVAINFFTSNKINKEDRCTKELQELYLSELLKSSTPNWNENSKQFNFNTPERVGWIIVEFNIENKNLSDIENIEYTRQFVLSKTDIEPTLVTVQNSTCLIGYCFPNASTTQDKERLTKYRYFCDVRKALMHTLEGNWSVQTDNYNETKQYDNIINSKFHLSGEVVEIGCFQNLLDTWKQTDTCKEIIRIKQAAGGAKSGITKRAMPKDKRKLLTEAACEKKMHMAQDRVEKTVKHILNTEDNPKLSIYHIVRISKQIKQSLSERTAKKYLPQIKIDLNIE